MEMKKGKQYEAQQREKISKYKRRTKAAFVNVKGNFVLLELSERCRSA